MAKSKWTKELVQERSNEIHNFGFIIHGIEVREIGKSKSKKSYIDIECKECKYRNWVLVNNHIRKSGCANCKNRIKRTKENVQLESNNIHNNKFIVHSLNIKTRINKKKKSYIDLECKTCGYRTEVSTTHHLVRKQDCATCVGQINWNIERAQEVSNKNHNNKFIILDLKRENIGNKGRRRTVVQVECKVCGFVNWVFVNHHVYGRNGCSGKCKHIINKGKQIEHLQQNPALANEPYILYFLKFINKLEKETFYKIGKTKNSIYERFKGAQYNDYIIEEVNIIESNHLLVALAEKEVIDMYYDKYKYLPKQKDFDGKTECFTIEIEQEFKTNNKIKEI